jgi:hypothetical protein
MDGEFILTPCEECGALLTCEHEGEWFFGWEGES